MRAGLPRLLVLMGSGETSPTMVTPHKEIFSRLRAAGGSMPALLLDTPFGFQDNAHDIVGRALHYFDHSVGEGVAVASYRSRLSLDDPVGDERALVRLREAGWAFAGPGSPTYALRQWRGTPIPELLTGMLQEGGAVVFASAAALTLGIATVPVYEIYKSGADPYWHEGLDVLGAATGLRAAVIPHFDNSEGGNHDTRFCYLGERRLLELERQLPAGAFVLGVDEHTGLVLDLDGGSATVVGRGGVTVRRDGRAHVLPTGTTLELEELGALGGEVAVGTNFAEDGKSSGLSRQRPAQSPRQLDPLAEAIAHRQADFDRSVAARSVPAAVAAVLQLEAELAAWSADTQESDLLDRGRAALRAMVVRLGELAESGAGDPREVVAPFVDLLLDLRAGARSDRRFTEADQVRDQLWAAGVEVRDTLAGAEWSLR